MTGPAGPKLLLLLLSVSLLAPTARQQQPPLPPALAQVFPGLDLSGIDLSGLDQNQIAKAIADVVSTIGSGGAAGGAPDPTGPDTGTGAAESSEEYDGSCVLTVWDSPSYSGLSTSRPHRAFKVDWSELGQPFAWRYSPQPFSASLVCPFVALTDSAGNATFRVRASGASQVYVTDGGWGDGSCYYAGGGSWGVDGGGALPYSEPVEIPLEAYQGYWLIAFFSSRPSGSNPIFEVDVSPPPPDLDLSYLIGQVPYPSGTYATFYPAGSIPTSSSTTLLLPTPAPPPRGAFSSSSSSSPSLPAPAFYSCRYSMSYSPPQSASDLQKFKFGFASLGRPRVWVAGAERVVEEAAAGGNAGGQGRVKWVTREELDGTQKVQVDFEVYSEPLDERAAAIAPLMYVVAVAEAQGSAAPVGPTQVSPMGLGGLYGESIDLISGYNVSFVLPSLDFGPGSVQFDIPFQPGDPNRRRGNFIKLYGQIVSDVDDDQVEISVTASGWVQVLVDNKVTIWDQVGLQYAPPRLPVDGSATSSGSARLEAGRPVPIEVSVDLNRVSLQSFRLRRDILAVLQWRSPRLCSGWGEEWASCEPRPVPQRNLIPLPCASGALVASVARPSNGWASSTSCRCRVDRKVPGERHCADHRAFTCGTRLTSDPGSGQGDDAAGGAPDGASDAPDADGACDKAMMEHDFNPALTGVAPCILWEGQVEEQKRLGVRIVTTCRFDDWDGQRFEADEVGEGSGFVYQSLADDGSFGRSLALDLQLRVVATDLKWLSSMVLPGQGQSDDGAWNIPASNLVGRGKAVSISIGDIPDDYWAGGRLYLEASLNHDFWSNPTTGMRLNSSKGFYIDKPPNRAENGMTAIERFWQRYPATCTAGLVSIVVSILLLSATRSTGDGDRGTLSE